MLLVEDKRRNKSRCQLLGQEFSVKEFSVKSLLPRDLPGCPAATATKY